MITNQQSSCGQIEGPVCKTTPKALPGCLALLGIFSAPPVCPPLLSVSGGSVALWLPVCCSGRETPREAGSSARREVFSLHSFPAGPAWADGTGCSPWAACATQPLAWAPGTVRRPCHPFRVQLPGLRCCQIPAGFPAPCPRLCKQSLSQTLLLLIRMGDVLPARALPPPRSWPESAEPRCPLRPAGGVESELAL